MHHTSWKRLAQALLAWALPASIVPVAVEACKGEGRRVAHHPAPETSQLVSFWQTAQRIATAMTHLFVQCQHEVRTAMQAGALQY